MERDEWQREQRQLAARGKNRVTEQGLKDTCGQWLIQAHKFGLLPDWPELRDLVAWHSEPNKTKLGDRQAAYVRCPSNLFLDFCGGGVLFLSGPVARSPESER